MLTVENKIHSIAIIGGGAAGVMAASYALHNNDDVILFPGCAKNKKKSRAFWVAKIENMPGLFSYKKAIDQPNRELLKNLEQSEFKESFTHLKNHSVNKLTKNENGYFDLEDNKGNKYCAKYVLLATGLMDVQPQIDGSIKPIFPYANIQLVDYCLRCDGHHAFGKRTTVIGNGAGAAWVSIMLHERYKPPEMKILTNGDKPEFSDELLELLNLYKIEVIKNKIVEVKGDAKAARLDGFVLDDGSVCDSDFSFVSLGMILYNKLAMSVGACADRRGFIQTDDNGKTSVPGLFVAGDLRAELKLQVYTAWDSAVDSINEINRLIRAEKNN